jgi:hypothetical protein
VNVRSALILVNMPYTRCESSWLRSPAMVCETISNRSRSWRYSVGASFQHSLQLFRRPRPWSDTVVGYRPARRNHRRVSPAGVATPAQSGRARQRGKCVADAPRPRRSPWSPATISNCRPRSCPCTTAQCMGPPCCQTQGPAPVLEERFLAQATPAEREIVVRRRSLPRGHH